MWINIGLLALLFATVAQCIDLELSREAAFQGRCGHGSPCDQLCYELHDGMYECDCTEGFELNKNGYSCQVINSTYQPNDINGSGEEDIFYQNDVSFNSAKIDNFHSHNNNKNISNSNFSGSSRSNSVNNNNNLYEISNNNSEIKKSNRKSRINKTVRSNYNYNNSQNTKTNKLNTSKDSSQKQTSRNNVHIGDRKQNVDLYDDLADGGDDISNSDGSNNDDINNNNSTENDNSDDNVYDDEENDDVDDEDDEDNDIDYNGNNISGSQSIVIKIANNDVDTGKTIVNSETRTNRKATASQQPDNKRDEQQMLPEQTEAAATIASVVNPLASNSVSNDANNFNSEDYYSKDDISIYDDVNNNRLNIRNNNNGHVNAYEQRNIYVANILSDNASNSNDTVKSYIHIEVYKGNLDDLTTAKAKDAPTLKPSHFVAATTTVNPSNLIGTTKKQAAKVSSASVSVIRASPTVTPQPCLLDCGPDGVCDNGDGSMRCMCPFGKTGNKCENVAENVSVPRFTKHSWIAFSALRGAYKHVQLHMEFRPETNNGIILLTGERDDLTGDFLAVLINQGIIEFWFDCGSGTGKVRSDKTVVLNQWNTLTVYRYRWDAWIQLNSGQRIQGRSKGLFSRITFREPVFLGGTGNITGLAKRLPISDGMTGCIRKFIANEHEYTYAIAPTGDIMQGFDVQECTTDRCGRYLCQHGGKCLSSDQGAICLCPLGFSGDLCEIRLDLQVPLFNGSSYLRFAPLGDTALIWLELKIIIKPQAENGLILYSGHHEYGDYIALSLNNGYAEFTFELGSGPAVVRSELPLRLGQWNTIRISRTARLAVMKIDQLSEVMIVSPNGFWHLSLPHSLYVGGSNNAQYMPFNLKELGSFIGCIQKMEINGRAVSIISEAVGGTNVDNCPHACATKPCGPLAQCVPSLDNYECQCNPSNLQCNKAEELSLQPTSVVVTENGSTNAESNKKLLGFTTTKQPVFDNFDFITAPTDNKQSKNKTSVKSTVGALYYKIATAMASMANDGNDKKYNRSGNAGRADDNSDSDDPDSGYDDDDDYYNYKNEDTQAVDADAGQESNLNIENKTAEMAANSHNNAASRQWSAEDKKFTTPTSTTVKAALKTKLTTSSTLLASSITNASENDDADVVVTRVFGRYMTVDTEKLLKKDEILRNKKLKKSHLKDSKPYKKHFIPMALLKPQPPSLVDDELEIDVEMPTSKNEHAIVNGGARQVKPVTEDAMEADELSMEMDSIGLYSNEDVLTTKELIDDMARIMKDGAAIRRNQMKHKSKYVKKGHGACFTGADSYFHYNDAETMRQVISYNIDLNLRFKTHSNNGLILWTGRHSAQPDDDYLLLGIENGYLHLRYNLGSGEVNIVYNITKVSDGLWHRIRILRNLQDGSIEVDGGKAISKRSPGKLRQLNTDTGLYVGGMPDIMYYTSRRYYSGVIGCISEIVLGGELKLSLDPETLGTAHNVEPGIF